jgi:putative multiple sugar transport system ATP-binding protein
VLKNGREIDVSTIGKAIAHGIAYVTEDRKGLGLILEEDIKKTPAWPTWTPWRSTW